MSNCITSLSLKDAPALIERLLPVQKLSAEAFKDKEGRCRPDACPAGSLLEGPQTAYPEQGLHPRLFASCN